MRPTFYFVSEAPKFNAKVIYPRFIKRASLNKKGIDYLSIKLRSFAHEVRIKNSSPCNTEKRNIQQFLTNASLKQDVTFVFEWQFFTNSSVGLFYENGHFRPIFLALNGFPHECLLLSFPIQALQ